MFFCDEKEIGFSFVFPFDVEGKQIFEGELASLKRFKDDVKEVKAGYECGLVFDGFDQMQEFDVVEAYIMVEVPR